jgi:hypothetical protein
MAEKPKLVRNSIPQQNLRGNQGLSVKAWNDYINILKEQSNANTRYLEMLNKQVEDLSQVIETNAPGALPNYDFPTNPTIGMVVEVAGTLYIWSGTAWSRDLTSVIAFTQMEEAIETIESNITQINEAIEELEELISTGSVQASINIYPTTPDPSSLGFTEGFPEGFIYFEGSGILEDTFSATITGLANIEAWVDLRRTSTYYTLEAEVEGLATLESEVSLELIDVYYDLEVTVDGLSEITNNPVLGYISGEYYFGVNATGVAALNSDITLGLETPTWVSYGGSPGDEDGIVSIGSNENVCLTSAGAKVVLSSSFPAIDYALGFIMKVNHTRYNPVTFEIDVCTPYYYRIELVDV